MISEEHAAIISYRTSEIGVVGADENDESAYLKKRGNVEEEEQSETEGGGDQKLAFPRGKLYGRNEELAQLQTLYDDVIDKQRQSQVVLLKGYSGCGKTALVEQFVQQARKKDISKSGSQELDTPPPPGLTPICIKGKYEEPNDRGDGTTSPPYKGILEALSFWYISLSAAERKAIDPVGQKIRETLREDAQLLVEILPALKRLWLGKSDNKNKEEDGSTTTATPSLTSSNNNGMPMKNKKRMHFVFYSLFKCLCSQPNSLPVVLFCDDLQWADAHTLELLLRLLTTTKEKGPLSLFVVLSVRCNHDSAPQVADIEKQLLEPLQSSSTITLTTIHVDNLTKADLGLFIADTLQSEDQEYILPLRDVIYSISLGNMFFAIQALEELARRNILYFDMMCFEWTWVDLSDENVLKDLISNDVMDLVTSKLKHMPPTLQNLLTVAAYTRSTLDANTWLEIYNACTDFFESFSSNSNLDDDDDNSQLPKESLLKLLRLGEDEGLLRSNSMNIDLSKSRKIDEDDDNICYSFAHDQIRVASRIFPHSSPKRNSLLQRIGNALAKRGRSDTVGEDWMLFTAMQQLNSIPRHYHGYSEDTQVGLARLNLETAQLAVGRAAFDDAAHCLKKAIQFLTTHDDNPWKRHFELCSSVYALAAEVAQMRGNVPELEKYSHAYLEAAQHLPIEANLRVYYTFARGLVYASDRSEEAKGIVLFLLDRLGLSFPPAIGRKTQAVRKMKWLVSKGKSPKTLERLENLEHMTDENLLKRMQLLDLMFDICYIANDELLLPLVIFEGFECTLKAGLSMHSPRFVGTVGFIFVSVLGDIGMAGKYGACALALMKTVNSKAIEAATLLVAYPMGCCWVEPVRDCIQPLRQGYEVGMHCGQADVAMGCVTNLIMFQFHSGIALSVLDYECSEYMPLMEEFGQRIMAIAVRRIWNVVLDLLGKEHTEHLGEMSEAELVNPKVVGALEMCHRLEKGYGGDYQACADSFVQSGTPKCYAGNAFVTNDVFVSAISCIAMARQNRSCCGDAYGRKAKQLRKVVSGWDQKGNPNAKHWKLLLDAEFAALKKRNKDAIAAYESAAELALAGGYIHDAAIFYERWGLFAAEEAGSDAAAEAENILEKSARLFLQWGCPKRAQLVRERIPKRVESACLK